jgi:hypothetical protein
VAASVLVHQERRANDLGLGKNWRCAIFFSAGYLTDPDDAQDAGIVRQMNPAVDGVVIRIPTAHIWSKADACVGYGERLSNMCDASTKEEVVHDLGHQIPGSRSEENLPVVVRAIERTVERALSNEPYK